MLIENILTFAAAQAHERDLLAGVAQGSRDDARFLLWRTASAVIVPRGLPGRDYFATAAAAVERLGFRLFERDTGGDLTPQDPGIINLTMAFRMDGEAASIAAAYRRLAQPVLDYLLERHGIEARLSAIDGAFCDGAFNVAILERKIAGTAQRWKLIGGEGASRRVAVLAHVALMVNNPLDRAIEALNAFYDARGSDRRIIRDRHVTLAEHLGRADLDVTAVARALEEFMAARRF